MVRLVYRDAILIDTSAVVALKDPKDRYHKVASEFFANQTGGPVRWCSVNITGHEAYTLTRYRKVSVDRALAHYDFLRSDDVQLIPFVPEDEAETRRLLLNYDDQQLSFHDVLCAAVMLRIGVVRIFTFDKDFGILGFQVVPGNI